MRTVILDSFTTDAGASGYWDDLSSRLPLTVHPRTSRDQVLGRATEAEAVILNKVRIDAGIIAALPRLRYIGLMSTGTNAVDLDAARARGIAVTNVPGYSTASVAQLVFAFILHTANQVSEHSAAVKSGRWAAGPDFAFWLHPMPELAGKTLVIIGQGAIGRAVTAIAQAFGMRVIAAQVPGSGSTGRTPLDEALPQADYISLHCPLTPRTERLVDARFLAALKPQAVLINTGRGGLIDEAALLAALEQGRLGGVGLDVLTQEPPPPDHPLLRPGTPWADQVTVTPHLAWATVESRRRLAGTVIANLLSFLDGGTQNRVV